MHGLEAASVTFDLLVVRLDGHAAGQAMVDEIVDEIVHGGQDVAIQVFEVTVEADSQVRAGVVGVPQPEPSAVIVVDGGEAGEDLVLAGCGGVRITRESHWPPGRCRP
ncbi:hypothetical protein GCM10020001_113380 [Nonomuraea salmonea]